MEDDQGPAQHGVAGIARRRTGDVLGRGDVGGIAGLVGRRQQLGDLAIFGEDRLLAPGGFLCRQEVQKRDCRDPDHAEVARCLRRGRRDQAEEIAVQDFG
jgi:hypothetical protein